MTSTVKNIVNETFKLLRTQFSAEEEYNGQVVLDTVKSTLVANTMGALPPAPAPMEFEEEPEVEDNEPEKAETETTEPENVTPEATTTEKSRDSGDGMRPSVFGFESENKENESKKEEPVSVPEAIQIEPVSHKPEQADQVQEHSHDHVHEQPAADPVTEIPAEQPVAHADHQPEIPVEHPLAAHHEEHSTHQPAEQPAETQSQPTEPEQPTAVEEKSPGEPKSLVEEVNTVLTEKPSENDWDEDFKTESSKPSDSVGNGTAHVEPTDVFKPESTAAVSDNEESKVTAPNSSLSSDPLGNLWGDDDDTDPFGASTKSKRDKKKKLEEEENQPIIEEIKPEEKKDDKKGFAFSATTTNDIFGTADDSDLFS